MRIWSCYYLLLSLQLAGRGWQYELLLLDYRRLDHLCVCLVAVARREACGACDGDVVAGREGESQKWYLGLEKGAFG